MCRSPQEGTGAAPWRNSASRNVGDLGSEWSPKSWAGQGSGHQPTGHGMFQQGSRVSITVSPWALPCLGVQIFTVPAPHPPCNQHFLPLGSQQPPALWKVSSWPGYLDKDNSRGTPCSLQAWGPLHKDQNIGSRSRQATKLMKLVITLHLD